ncbi:MAG: riboflavin biosynthesis protein RibF [Clostridia bacterium]|nr:riboflavin biosynthesis protein RibF [Clostridia bacterium]
MLKTVQLTKQLNSIQGAAMMLGGFDGLHVGHRRLLACAKESGLPVGLMTIVGGKEEENLFTFTEREEIFRLAGADFVFELPFEEIKGLAPQEFLQLLEKEFAPKLLVCGEDFRFGAKAVGTPKMIKESTQVCVEVLPLVEIEGEKVSSTTIKTLLEQGKVEKANKLLTHPFFLRGKVYADRKIGRTIGFPTANIRYPEGKFPLKIGVYETRVSVDGCTYKGITNYGARPTFEENTVVTETYLDGFSGDLYGKKLKVEFVRYLRDIVKFDSVDELKNQLTKDIERVKAND